MSTGSLLSRVRDVATVNNTVPVFSAAPAAAERPQLGAFFFLIHVAQKRHFLSV